MRARNAYVQDMKLAMNIAVAVALAAAPVQAQDGKESLRQGADLLEQGTRLLLEGLMKEIGPVMLELQGKLVDLSAYYAPEILPNGDIIIRRKVPLVPEVPEQGETDL